MYFQGFFAFDRVKALAPKHPEWKTTQPFKGILENDMKAVAAAGEKGLMESHRRDPRGDDDRGVRADREGLGGEVQASQAPAALHGPGLPADAGAPRATSARTASRPSSCRVAASTSCASSTEQVYGISPEQVVGSVGEAKFEMRNGKPVLVKLPKINLVDDKAGKPVGIHRFIGRRPILAFGNSDGDQQMLEWTAAGDGAPVHGHRPPHRRASASGPTTAKSLDRPPRQGARRGHPEELDGRRHEAGVEGHLPVPEVGRSPNGCGRGARPTVRFVPNRCVRPVRLRSHGPAP